MNNTIRFNGFLSAKNFEQLEKVKEKKGCISKSEALRSIIDYYAERELKE